MTELTYYLDGEYIPASQAKVSVNDRGFRLGDAVFDTERTFNGRVFKLREHLERLYRSLKFIRIDPGLALEELEEVTLEVVRRNEPLRSQYGDYWVTQVISRGSGHSVLEGYEPTVSVVMNPLPFHRFAGRYASGAHLVIPSVRRTPPDVVEPKVKSTNRLNLVLADIEARQVDQDAYPLLLDHQGNLAEIVSGNVFVVTGEVVRTPGPRNVLCGVTRQTTVELARSLDIPVVEEDLQPYDLYVADEAFVTTTSFCVLPVSRLNGAPVGVSVPGPITRRLLSAWSEMVGLDIVEQAMRHASR